MNSSIEAKFMSKVPDANCSGEEPKKNGELVSEELGQCGDRKGKHLHT